MTYEDFIEAKSQAGGSYGFEPLWMPAFLFDFQKESVAWNLRKGRSALFADTGLGKTAMELVFAENVVRATNKPVLILTPLAVSTQTVREAEKFGIDAKRCQDGKIKAGAHSVVTNYERLHCFNPADFSGVVCDESGICKNFSGVRKNEITEFMKKVPYRLMASATPSPNDYHELGTHAEALGELGYMDMLNRFFMNDNNNSSVGRSYGEAVQWRFKGHAELPFFRWVCSWARAYRKPSDLGFSDERYVLPALTETVHMVESSHLRDGCLFPTVAVGLFEQREERKVSLTDRCERVAELVANTGKQSLIWCQLNPEGDLLEKLIPGAVQISGRDTDEQKEAKWLSFIDGTTRVMISKQKIGGWGLNLQNCSHVVAFPDHSAEAYYQGVRRCWRFGQKNQVQVDLVITEGQQAVLANLRRKLAAADRMFEQMLTLMDEALKIDRNTFKKTNVSVPAWLKSVA